MALLPPNHLSRRSGFSLVEVVLATGLCTYALLVIASVLPVGMVMMQGANQQIVCTEIFNQVWAKYNTTPFYSLQNSNGTVAALFPTAGQAVYSFYDGDGQDTTPPIATTTPPAGSVYIVRSSLVNSSATVPAVTAQNSSGASLAFIQVQIGFHFDPANLATGTSDPRVVTRTFLLAKRDTWNGS